MIMMELIGGFALRQSDGTLLALPRKAAALLTFLAFARDRPVPRDRLAGLLWEDASETQARTSLRQAMAAVRRVAVPADPFRAEGPGLLLDPAVIASDVDRFERLAAGTAAERVDAASLFEGDLLDGFGTVGSAFSAWLAAERARLRAIAVALLEETAAAALAGRRHEEALALALRLVTLEPLHEPGHRLTMEALAAAGRPGEAIRHYRQVQARLRAELGVAPEPETVALATTLAARRRDGPGEDAPDAAEPTTAARRALRRVAVLSVALAPGAAPQGIDQGHRLREAWQAEVNAAAAAADARIESRGTDSALLLFGATRARLDDPRRAAAAALDLLGRTARLEAIAGQPVGARAGLAVGVLLLADGGEAALGEPLGLAARLAAEAGPGELLAPASLCWELGPRLIGQARGSERITIRALAAEAPDNPPGEPLIGRSREFQHLAALLAAAGAGSGLAVVVRGEPGIGKSRLADALAQHATGKGCRVLRAEIADIGDLAQRTPRRQLVEALLGAGSGQPAARLVGNPLFERIDTRHRPFLVQLSGHAPTMAMAHQLREDGGEVGRDAAWIALLAAAASEAPLLLLVEDAHWASPGALRQLAVLSRAVETMPALLVMTTRAEEDPFDPAWRAMAGGLVTLDLPPLPEAQLVDAAVRWGAAPAAAAICARRANGNPLYLRQLVAALRDGADPARALPGSVQGLALARLDRLDPTERTVLAAAAILGRTGSLEALAQVGGISDWAPSTGAASLIRVADGEFQFAHALVRDAIRTGILESDARTLHLAAADWYAMRQPAVAAAHWLKAGDARAAAAFADAAQAELARHRADKALDLADRGQLAATGPADRACLAMQRAAALLRLGRAREAAEAANHAASLAATPADRVAGLVLAADALAAALDTKAALAVLAEAETAAMVHAFAEPLARIHALRGNLHFPRGRLAECLEAHRQSLHWATVAQSPLAEAGARAGLAWAQYQRGDFAAAATEASKGLALAQDDGFDRIRLSAYRVRAVSRLFLLEHEAAQADAEAAIALAAEQRDSLNEVLARTTLATLLLERWEPDAAEEVAAVALDLARAHASVGMEAAPLWVLGTAAGARGDAVRSVAFLEQARSLAAGSPAIRFALPRILGTLAFFAPAEARAQLIEEGEAELARAAVAHSAFGFWGSAIHAGLVHRDRALVHRCEVGLARFAGETPWAVAMLAMARIHGRLLAPNPTDADRQAAIALHARARACRALTWHRPTMRAVEQHAGLR